MARLARFTGDWLNAWRKGWTLSVAEMALMHGIPRGTMEDKLYGRHPPRTDTERLLDCWELMLAAGLPPPRWPEKKRCLVRANRLDIEPKNGNSPELPGLSSRILPLIG